MNNYQKAKKKVECAKENNFNLIVMYLLQDLQGLKDLLPLMLAKL